MKSSLKWKAERLNLFGLNGVTSNISESINETYQEHLDKEKKPLIEAIRTAMLLMVSRLEEIRRSIRGDGDLKVKMDCKLKLEKILPPEQADYFSLPQLGEIFNDGSYSHRRPSDYLPNKKYIISKQGLANFFVKCNRVMIIYDHIFVRGLYDDTVHVTKFQQLSF